MSLVPIKVVIQMMVNTLRKTQSQGFLLNGVLSLEMAMVNGIMNWFRKRIYGIPFSDLQKKPQQ